jgi:aspartyl-tRNA(Asn)/glutamyl-tRNA(Gln) amidotransferase subunit B
MCRGERYGISVVGTEQDVLAATAESVYDAYKSLLSGARCEIFYVGRGGEERVARTFADLFEETVRAGVEAKECANWLLGPIRKQLHDAGVDEDSIRLSSNALAAILACVAAKRINRASAIALLEEFLLHGGIADTDVDRLIEERGYAQIGDSHAIMSTVQSVIAQNPAAIEDYLAGKKRAEGFLIGQTMKAMGGRADPTAVKEAVGAALKQIMLT